MPEPIFRGISPTSEPAPPKYDVKSPPRKGDLDMTVVGLDVLGVPTHWAPDPRTQARRSMLCDGEDNGCVWCGVEPRCPLFFVAGWDHALGCRFILRLGAEGAKALEACAGRAGRLRGLRCLMGESSTQYGRVIVCRQAREAPLTPLISPFLIDHVVARLLKVSALPGWLTRRELLPPDGGDR